MDSKGPSSASQRLAVDSKVPGSWGGALPVFSTELPSSHGQPVLVDSGVVNSQCQIREIFTYSQLEEATNNFDSNRIIGSGGDYGTVYYGKLKDGRHVAIKRMHEVRFKILRLHDEKPESERLRKFMDEVAILTCLKHDNLVQLYGCTSPQSHELILVQEYIPNKTVVHHLLGNDILPWSARLNIAIQTASGLAFLHANNIIHRDVKTSNILLDKNLTAKVSVYGFSRSFSHGHTHVTTGPTGTQGYVDPEYYEHCHLSCESDVYSFGVVLMELISSLPAFSVDSKPPFLSEFAMDKIRFGQLHELVDPSLGFQSDKQVSETISAVADLACRCLQSRRDMRPSMLEVVNTLESIRGGSSTWGPKACYKATKVHIVSRFKK